jgi:putative FmdB family regulatory protein
MLVSMPLYEYRCRTCDTTFDLRRSMSESNDPADCPSGHPGAVRLLSVFASTGGASSSPAPSAPRGGGGGCGASCGCAH